MLYEQLLRPCTPRGVRLLEQHLAAGLEDVEGDEVRRQLLGEPYGRPPAG
ncbi:hypothetical protein ACIP4Y_36165 [Streptomyces sp. NPDC088810]